jgi:uncharacterized protein involved in type VI secretion and phage assembly
MQSSSGFLPGVVVDNLDPDNLGRVKVRFRSGNIGRELWARVATLMAGNNRGTWFIPDVKDEVLLAFESGRSEHAYVIGSLWSVTNPPPEGMRPGNDRKVVRSRTGLKVTLDDQTGSERILVETPSGHKIRLEDGSGEIDIIDTNGNAVKLHSGGVDIDAAANVIINCSEAKIRAASINFEAGISNFRGVVKCDTLITNSVVSASYTPGVGNIW